MKTLLIGFIAVWTLTSVALAQDSLESRIRESKLQDAALRAVEESMESLAERLSNAQQLTAIMLDNPVVHMSRIASEKRLYQHEQDRLRREFRAQLEQFARHLPELSEQWTDKTMNDNRERIDQAIVPLLAASFDPTYREAREAAVVQQAARVNLQNILYPSPEEIETLTDVQSLLTTQPVPVAAIISSQQGQSLINSYMEQVTADHDLFEENRQQLGGRIALAITEELIYWQRQLLQVQSYRASEDSEIIEASELRDDILASVEPDPGRGIYPSVRVKAEELAGWLEIELFRVHTDRQLDPENGCPALSPQTVYEHIPDSVEQIPVSAAIHLEQLQSTLLGAAHKRLVSGYAAKLDGGAMQSFAERLYAYLSEADPQGVDSTFQAGLIRCLEGPVSQRRQQLASWEIESKRPALIAGTMELSDPELKTIQGKVGEALRQVEISALASFDDLRLEETRDLFQAQRLRLLEEGKFAVESQVNLVARHRSEFTEKIKQDPERKTRQQFWQEAYEKAVLNDWRAVRDSDFARGGQVLAANKYDRVFESTSALITDLLPTDWEPGTTDAQTAPAQTIQAGSCEPVADICLQASMLCYEALKQCSEDGKCTSREARCLDAMQRCQELNRSLKG